MQPFDFSQLDTLFAPRSIAVVGASEQTSKIGGIPLDYLLRFGYDGQLHAANPRAGVTARTTPATITRKAMTPMTMIPEETPAIRPPMPSSTRIVP